MKSYENHINGNLYAYAANNPVYYTDPDGREVFLLDADYVLSVKEKNIVNKLIKTIEIHSDDKYIVGTKENNWNEFRCDSFNETILKESGFNPLDYMAGPAISKNVDEHIANALNNNLAEKADRNESPCIGGGAYIVYMDEGKWGEKKVDSHGGIILFKDGKVLYSDNSSSNRKKTGGVQTRTYGSILEFQSDYGETYKNFYYIQINE